MPLYDPNGTKQKPIVRNGTGFFSHATCPTNETHNKRPSYVMINKPGTYTFSYENTPSTYVTGSIVLGDDDRGNSPIRLYIQPTAWRGTSGNSVGDVTFVYVRVG